MITVASVVNNRDEQTPMRLKIAKILPLAFADTLRHIRSAERNDPERLSKLYLRFGSILKRIREKRGLTIQALSVLSGVPEELLEAAESGTVEMTDAEAKGVRDVYWTLETDQASDDDYKRIVDQRLSKPHPSFGSSMTQIRDEKQITIAELASISGVA
jgi:DNA-binding transcriptional regulator YiaG